jgi:hypothetical protein
MLVFYFVPWLYTNYLPEKVMRLNLNDEWFKSHYVGIDVQIPYTSFINFKVLVTKLFLSYLIKNVILFAQSFKFFL